MNEKYLQTTKRALIGILSGFALAVRRELMLDES